MRHWVKQTNIISTRAGFAMEPHIISKIPKLFVSLCRCAYVLRSFRFLSVPPEQYLLKILKFELCVSYGAGAKMKERGRSKWIEATKPMEVCPLLVYFQSDSQLLAVLSGHPYVFLLPEVGQDGMQNED